MCMFANVFKLMHPVSIIVLEKRCWKGKNGLIEVVRCLWLIKGQGWHDRFGIVVGKGALREHTHMEQIYYWVKTESVQCMYGFPLNQAIILCVGQSPGIVWLLFYRPTSKE